MGWPSLRFSETSREWWAPGPSRRTRAGSTVTEARPGRTKLVRQKRASRQERTMAGAASSEAGAEGGMFHGYQIFAALAKGNAPCPPPRCGRLASSWVICTLTTDFSGKWWLEGE